MKIRYDEKEKCMNLDGEANLIIFKSKYALELGHKDDNGIKYDIRNFILYAVGRNFKEKWKTTKFALKYIWKKEIKK